jgi:4-amino-4-deoxy-L-arabinose transferase-like glycosyltransferase
MLYNLHAYLNFSDAAKFADVARNIVYGIGKVSNFNFWGTNNSNWIQPVTPYSIATFFKIFGINDFAVIATSFFYFLLSLVLVFLLAQKIYKDRLVSFLSTLAVGFNYNLINYGTSGASESPFIFEILAATYFVSLKKWWGNALGIVFAVLLYFTRPQAIIYILGLVFYYFLNNFKLRA